MTIERTANPILAAQVSCHFFSDGSGMVLFHQLTGESVGLALTETEFVASCQQKQIAKNVQFNDLQTLKRMLSEDCFS